MTWYTRDAVHVRIDRSIKDRSPPARHPEPRGMELARGSRHALEERLRRVPLWVVDWIGLDRIGSDWIGSDRIGLDWIGLDWIGSDRIGLDWIGSNWIGSDRIA